MADAAATDENRCVPGQARLSLVRESPLVRLMRGPSRHRELFASSTSFSVVISVGPAGHVTREPRRCRRWRSTARLFSDHPKVERIVHEQVGQQRRDRRTPPAGFPSPERPVWHLQGGSEPPFDVEQDPALVGVASDRFEQQIMRNAVEGARTSTSNTQSCFPTTLSGHGQSIMSGAPRTVAVAVGVEDRLQLLFQQHRCCGLVHPVDRIRDSGVIPPPGLWTVWFGDQ